MSLDAIGERAGKHPSTASYWLKRHGLRAVGRARHAPKGTVDQIRLRELAEGGASIREIAAELDVSYSTTRYWLERCGLETNHAARRRESTAAREAGLSGTHLKCATHGRTSFFRRRDGGGFRCRRCNSMAVSERRRKVKRQLVEEAGGACVICGFSAHPRALEFHHLDPATKKFPLSNKGLTRGIHEMRAEAAKCGLLCANCHALVEAGVKKAPSVDR
jgi:transposase-like protein